jgi:NAD(P)-dependent dehydrogenase (short-subunit alcohol dehydrogenase family)
MRIGITLPNLGRAIAQRLGKDGASVVVNYVGSEDKAQEVVEIIKSEGGQAISVHADVSKTGDVHRQNKTHTEGVAKQLIDYVGKTGQGKRGIPPWSLALPMTYDHGDLQRVGQDIVQLGKILNITVECSN